MRPEVVKFGRRERKVETKVSFRLRSAVQLPFNGSCDLYVIEERPIRPRRRELIYLRSVQRSLFPFKRALRSQSSVKPMFRSKSFIVRFERKHIEIRSNIGSEDLNTKVNLIRRFVSKGCKVTVLAKFSKFATSINAYETFVNNLKVVLHQVGTSVLGPTHSVGGSVTFSVSGTRMQSC